MTVRVTKSMLDAFNAVQTNKASSDEPYNDVVKEAIAAAIEVQQPWDRFLQARTACIHDFTAAGYTDERITRELSFVNQAHMERIRHMTKPD